MRRNRATNRSQGHVSRNTFFFSVRNKREWNGCFHNDHGLSPMNTQKGSSLFLLFSIGMFGLQAGLRAARINGLCRRLAVLHLAVRYSLLFFLFVFFLFCLRVCNFKKFWRQSPYFIAPLVSVSTIFFLLLWAPYLHSCAAQKIKKKFLNVWFIRTTQE